MGAHRLRPSTLLRALISRLRDETAMSLSNSGEGERLPPLKVALKTSVENTLKTTSAIMEAMEKDPGVTIPEIAKAISVSARTVHNHIRRLKEADLIRRVGPDKGWHWEVCGE